MSELVVIGSGIVRKIVIEEEIKYYLEGETEDRFGEELRHSFEEAIKELLKNAKIEHGLEVDRINSLLKAKTKAKRGDDA